jgi:hypothetical protein
MKPMGILSKIKEAAFKGERLFVIKVALCNSLIYCLIVGWVTFVDAQLTTRVFYGDRHYRGGYAVSLIGGLIILVSTLLSFAKVKPWMLKATFPSLILIAVCAASLPFFRPEFPHGGMTTWTLFLSLVSAASCWTRCLPIPHDWLNRKNLSAAVKIERIKEYANIWRTAAISITIGYMAVLIPWTDFFWNQSASFVVAPHERILLSQFGSGLLLATSLYVLVGVIYEVFRKANQSANLMLEVIETRSDA